MIAQTSRSAKPGNHEYVPQVAVDRNMFSAVLRVVRWAEACEGSCRTVVVDSGVRRVPLPDSLTDSGVVMRLPSAEIMRLSNARRTFTLGRYQRRPVHGDTVLVVITVSPHTPSDGSLEFLLHLNPATNRWGAGAWVQVVRQGKYWRAVLVRQDVS